jgi:tryptophanyl-tRNA synthetase
VSENKINKSKVSNNKPRVLTGITPSGSPHLGNYKGMYEPMIELANQTDNESFCMISDYHSLVKLWDPKARKEFTHEITATWLALGLDPDKSNLYLQSHIPEIPELSWIISTLTAKGLLNRAHAYKAKLDENVEAHTKDPDAGITAGLYQYPILMSADILIVNANIVPVGKDQIQHLEIARDIAARFNHIYGEAFVLPEAQASKHQSLLGLDGRKMSKSYNNTIPLFLEEKALRKRIMKIKTNSQLPEEPKDHNDCILFSIYSAFANESEIKEIKTRYQTGIGWGEMKQILFEKINIDLKDAREKYQYFINNPDVIDKILKKGCNNVRSIATPFMEKIKKQIGLY